MINKSNKISAILTKAMLDVERSEIPIHRGWILDALIMIQFFFTKIEVNF